MLEEIIKLGMKGEFLVIVQVPYLFQEQPGPGVYCEGVGGIADQPGVQQEGLHLLAEGELADHHQQLQQEGGLLHGGHRSLNG